MEYLANGLDRERDDIERTGGVLLVRYLLLGLTAALIPLSFVAAPYPEELVLQHVPTVLVLLLLLVLTPRLAISWWSFLCIMMFLWMHLLGARWIYSFVPYDDWTRLLTGSSLSEQFGWQRNHYDRLVHLASGILGVPIASEALQRMAAMRPLGGVVLGVSIVLAVGAAYEILEWQLAVWLSPEQAEAYNGQQGDVWDPQKDLALAGIGAIVSAACFFRWKPV